MKKLLSILMIGLYSVYLISGLQLLFNAHNLSQSNQIVSWKNSVICMFFAHLINGSLVHGSFFFIYFLIATIFCFSIEEISLNTGLPFGSYHFTENFGFKITNDLPLFVLVLWHSLIYPSIIASNLILFGKSYYYSMKSPNFAYPIFLTAIILTSFDLVSEPIAVNFGYKVN